MCGTWLKGGGGRYCKEMEFPLLFIYCYNKMEKKEQKILKLEIE